MAVVDETRLCVDTSVLIAYLKGREPGATAIERADRRHLPRTLSASADPERTPFLSCAGFESSHPGRAPCLIFNAKTQRRKERKDLFFIPWRPRAFASLRLRSGQALR